jgi:hypothetical protein
MLCSRSGFLLPFQSSTSAVKAVRSKEIDEARGRRRGAEFHNKESLVNRDELPQLPLC